MSSLQNLHPAVLLLFTWLWLGCTALFSFRAGRRFKTTDHSKSDAITSHTMALLAFIMGFSFSMAVTRYEKRKELVVEEANAISTSYLQSKLIKFKYPQRVKELYVSYVDKRIQAYKEENPQQTLNALDDLENEIWQELILVTRETAGPLESSYTNATNTFFDTANARKHALFKFLPAEFYLLILLLATASIGSLNYDRGRVRDETNWKVALFIFLFGLIYVLIFDLDHPRKGLIRIDQEALIELRNKM